MKQKVASFSYHLDVKGANLFCKLAAKVLPNQSKSTSRHNAEENKHMRKTGLYHHRVVKLVKLFLAPALLEVKLIHFLKTM